MVGHSFIVYGPLLHRLTTVVYEGKPIGTLDASNFWRVIERHSVHVLLTAPTALRVIKRADSKGVESFDTIFQFCDIQIVCHNFDLSKLRHLLGERL